MKAPTVRFIITPLIFAAISTSQVLAQSVPSADIKTVEDTVRKQQASEASSNNARRSEAQNQSSTKSEQPNNVADPLMPPEGGPCFEIKDIILDGFEPFGQPPNGYKNLVGTCATAAAIAEVLNGINQYYQETGFITTRAYVPEQDIADGSIEITIIPGVLEGYVYSNGAPADTRIKAAFPAKRGQLLNLRDLEQGLDNINGPKSANAKFELVPGERPGGSFVSVGIEDQKPWHLDFNIDNSGFENTGKYKASANLTIDNSFGLNDQLGLSVSSTPLDRRAKKFSDSYSMNWKVPVGNWSYGVDIGRSGYFFILPGINQSYPVEGNSHYYTFSAERLLQRNQVSKSYFYGDLKLSRSKTFIESFEIESQRRRLSVASLGIRGEKTPSQGKKFTWDVGVKFGLDAFNSYVLDKSIVNPTFKLLKARFSYETPLNKAGLNYKGSLFAQYSNDILPGTEQISIGGWSTVRGFHDDSMYGDTGAYLRNSLEWDSYKDDNFDVKLTAGLDIGYVKPSTLRNWSQNHLVGASLGAEIKIRKSTTLTMQFAHALSRPTENPPNSQPAFEASRNVFHFALRTEF